MSSSRGSFQPRDRTQVSCIAGATEHTAPPTSCTFKGSYRYSDSREVPRSVLKCETVLEKAVPEAKKQKVEGTEPTTSFNLFVGNLNFNKSSPELKMVSVIFLLKIILLLSMSELVYLGSLAMWILNLPKTWKKPWNSLV